MYLHTNRKNNSPLCCHVPPAVRIAYGLISALAGEAYSQWLHWRPLTRSALGVRGVGRAVALWGMLIASRCWFRAAKVAVETMTPASEEERSRLSSTGNWNTGNGEGWWRTFRHAFILAGTRAIRKRSQAETFVFLKVNDTQESHIFHYFCLFK